SGAQAIIRSLELLGVDTVFGLPGGAILPTYDPLMDSSKIRHILVRHEQGAGHAAEGYAAASGRLGVCIATSGPGATNLVTAIADAHMDSVPMLAITGQVNSHAIGTDAFQEADIVGITMPITKHSFLVTKAEDIPAVMASAYEIATTGRPGPVLVDVAKDAQNAKFEFSWPPTKEMTPGYKQQVQAAAELILQSKKPILYVGGGVIRAGAHKELHKLAKLIGAPVTTTLMARGAYPDSDPQHLGMPGMHGTVPAVTGLQKADLLITLGARFDDRVTGDVKTFAKGAKVIHVDIDPAEIIVGDAKVVIAMLTQELEKQLKGKKYDISEWWSYLNGLKERYPLGYNDLDDGKLAPQYVIERIGQLSGTEAIYAAGVGQHQMWSAQFINYENPNTWLNSGGAGTMGYAVPAAMGAKVAMPEKLVWAIDGDGCFQMTNQELATCTINQIPIKVAIINNSSLGMVRQWQTLFYNKRYSNTDLHTGTDTQMVPDFVKLSDAYGCLAIRVEKVEEVDAAIKLAMETNDRPVVIDFIVGRDAMVWPMVPAGVSNDAVQYARDAAPIWDGEE
ncbi:MAG: acetolactate synthase large subunit, partial [Actinobacteria bacterium]|nr:acetolactate synthase large subunit [Actinomycetota bacterium]